MISSSFFFPLPIARIIAPCSRAVLLLLALPHLPQVNAQTSAVVHQFNVTVAEELKTELSVNDRSRNVMSEFSVGTALPEELVDSMAVDAERALTQKLGFPVHMCWTKGRRGTGAGGFLGQYCGPRVVVASLVWRNHVFSGSFFFQAEDGIRDLVRSRGRGDVYKRQPRAAVVQRRGVPEGRHGARDVARSPPQHPALPQDQHPGRHRHDEQQHGHRTADAVAGLSLIHI